MGKLNNGGEEPVDQLAICRTGSELGPLIWFVGLNSSEPAQKNGEQRSIYIYSIAQSLYLVALNFDRSYCYYKGMEWALNRGGGGGGRGGLNIFLASKGGGGSGLVRRFT